MLLRPRTMREMVITNLIATRNYQRVTHLIDKILVQYLSQNTIDMNMIMESHQMIKDRRKVYVKS